MDILKHLHNEREFSDLTVICGKDTHLLHRNIVIPQAPVFRNRLHHLFTPCDDLAFHLETTDPDAFRFLVCYLYRGDYTKDPSFLRATTVKQMNGKTDNGVVVSPGTSEPASNMLVHLKVYFVAIDFECEALRELAKKNFAALVAFYGRTKSFVEAFEYIFSAKVDEELRKVALEGIATHRTWQVSEKADKLIQSLSISHDVLRLVDRHLATPIKRKVSSSTSSSTPAYKVARHHRG